jgi:hypothetical protein
MRRLTLNNLAIQRSTAQSEQRERQDNPKTLAQRLREARDQEAAEERARRESVVRRLERVR